MTDAKAPLSNMQMELLKLYSAGVPDAYLEDIKVLVARFLFAKSRTKADKIWDDSAYSDELINELVRQHLKS